MIDVLYEYQINLIFRMIIACLCGVAIGTERKNRAKEAGMRTHCISCMCVSHDDDNFKIWLQ